MALPFLKTVFAVEDRKEMEIKTDGNEPVKIVIDLSGGLIQAVSSTAPVEILVIDEDDCKNPRGNKQWWYSYQEGEINPDEVKAIFGEYPVLP